jgi:hypothetical protein
MQVVGLDGGRGESMLRRDEGGPEKACDDLPGPVSNPLTATRLRFRQADVSISGTED